MSIPPLLEDTLQRIEDLAAKRGSAGPGPLRIEIPFERTAELSAETLRYVAILALRGTAESAASARAALEDSGLQRPPGRELWFDVEWDAGWVDPATWSPELGALTARMKFRLAGPTLPDPAALATWSDKIAGHIAIDLDSSAADFGPWLESLPALARPLSISLRDTPEVTAAQQNAWKSLAEERAIGLGIAGGARIAPGRPLDPLAPWNVLTEMCRSAFREFPGLCPFPFLMLRVDGERLGLCPRADGPALPDAESWNAAPAEALRRAFHDGSPEAPCPSCDLHRRVRSSLEAHAPRDGKTGFSV